MKEKHKDRKKRYSSSRSYSSDRSRTHKYKHQNKNKKRDKSSSQDRHKNKQKYKQRHRSPSKDYPEQKTVKFEYEQKVKRENSKGFESSPERQENNESVNNQEAIVKEEPNFEPSGILLEFYNARDGVSLKFNQPAEAHKPLNEWRVYPFKDKSPMNPILLKESCYLIGKDERVCDILCENPSISRQHAVIQFRSQYSMGVEVESGYVMVVKPYIMDLESTNGTFLNDEKVEHSRYYELLHNDILKFGLSDREYVIFKVPDNEE